MAARSSPPRTRGSSCLSS